MTAPALGLALKRLVTFDEAQHPRDEDGKFAEKPGGYGGQIIARIQEVFGFKDQKVDALHEELTEAHNAAYYGGFTNTGEYQPFADSTHPYITEQGYDRDELGDQETAAVDLAGIAKWATRSEEEDNPWVGQFQYSRDIRKAANRLAGVSASPADPHVNTIEVGFSGRQDDPRDAVIALAMMQTIVDSPPTTMPLYRGTLIDGGNVDDVLASLTGELDMPLLSTTDARAISEAFAAGRYGRTGPVVMFTFPPGTHAFEGMSGLEADAISGGTVEGEGSEWIVGGRFRVDSARISPTDPNRIDVVLRQTAVHSPWGTA